MLFLYFFVTKSTETFLLLKSIIETYTFRFRFVLEYRYFLFQI